MGRVVKGLRRVAILAALVLLPGLACADEALADVCLAIHPSVDEMQVALEGLGFVETSDPDYETIATDIASAFFSGRFVDDADWRDAWNSLRANTLRAMMRDDSDSISTRLFERDGWVLWVRHSIFDTWGRTECQIFTLAPWAEEDRQALIQSSIEHMTPFGEAADLILLAMEFDQQTRFELYQDVSLFDPDAMAAYFPGLETRIRQSASFFLQETIGGL